jgi:hypothetical protein
MVFKPRREFMFKVVIVNLFVLAFAVIKVGFGANDILDVPSAIFVFIPAFIAPLATYNFAEYKTAFAIAFRSKEISKEEKESLAGFFTLMGNVAFGFGWMAFFLSHIAILKNLMSIPDVKLDVYGIGFAASLITVLYGYIFKYGFCEIAEKRITRK